jgi:hypothetical protein
MTTTEQQTKHFRVQRTLSYAHTSYGTYADLDRALAVAQSQSVLGYPSEVIDLRTGEHHRPPYWNAR